MSKSIPQIFEEIQEAFDRLFIPKDATVDDNNDGLISDMLKHKQK
jgi:hypothetical protein